MLSIGAFGAVTVTGGAAGTLYISDTGDSLLVRGAAMAPIPSALPDGSITLGGGVLAVRADGLTTGVGSLAGDIRLVSAGSILLPSGGTLSLGTVGLSGAGGITLPSPTLTGDTGL